MRTKHIDICHRFMRDLVEDKDIDIKYIRSEKKTGGYYDENCSEADCVKHRKRITEGELWELVETGRENVKNIGVTDDITERDKTEYSIHALA